MLSAIMVIGACAMVLAAVGGLIAIVLMFLNRIRMLIKAFRDCGLTIGAARDGFHAIVADAKARPGSYLLGVAIFCAFVLFAEYILLGLVALGTLAIPLAAIGRRRGSTAPKIRSADVRSSPGETEMQSSLSFASSP
jgi:hypothetical protein